METQQVTVGFKVPAKHKKKIEKAARKMDLDVSAYMRALLYRDHEKVNRLRDMPDRLIIDEALIPEVVERLEALKARYENASYSEIILAALRVGEENEHRLISNKIGDHLIT